MLCILLLSSHILREPRDWDAGVGDEEGVREEGGRKPVFSGDREKGRGEEGRGERSAKTILGCFEEAAGKVGGRRQMKGVLEFERGRVSFLVYRID